MGNTANQVWDKVLASDEAQKLVKRVADAPEIREAIASQGIGVLEDVRRGVRSAARRFDTMVENGARRVLRNPHRERRPRRERRPPRERRPRRERRPHRERRPRRERRPQRERRPIFAGAFSRVLALAIDAGVVYGTLLVISAAIAFLISIFEPGDQTAGAFVLALGATIWVLIASLYLLILWSGAGQTVGMAFVAIRMLSDDGSEVRPGQAFRRLIWLVLSALPLFLGYWGVLFEGERRGWPDRRAHTVVCYADPELDEELA